MRSATALWFPIETTFLDIQDLCVRARAAQLVQQQQAKKPALNFKRTLVSTPSAPTDDDDDDDSPRFARANELARDPAFREENGTGPDLVELRDLIRKRLKRLEGRFAEVLSDYDRYYALFPLVVYIDEFVQVGMRGELDRWQPLQGELFDEDNGGETFFTILEEKLKQSETHPLILEIFYFCLSDGFSGVYSNDAKKLEEYRLRLAERIPLRPVAIAPRDTPHQVELVPFPWAFYAIAIAAVVGAHLLFTWLALPTTS